MKKQLLMLCLIAVSLAACTDAKRSKIGGLNNQHRVEVMGCDGPIKTYISTGKVGSEENSDGYYFKDAATGELVEVSGNVVITQLED